MSSARRELGRIERDTRARLAGHLGTIGSQAGELAGSSARNHPWGHVATGGLLGLLLGARWGSRRAAPTGARPRWMRIPPRLALAWILRGLTPG